MTVNYPPMVMVIVAIQILVTAEVLTEVYSLPVPGIVVLSVAIAVGVLLGVVWLYSPLPDVNGGMGTSNRDQGWGWPWTDGDGR